MGGCAGSVIGCGLCHPFDVIKIRLQVQGEGMQGLGKQHELGMLSMFKHIVRTEGIVSGFSYGISSQILRAASYYAIKIGLYDVIKQQVFGERPGKSISLERKIAVLATILLLLCIFVAKSQTR